MSTPLDDLAAVEREMRERRTEDTNVTAHVFMPQWAVRIQAAREGIEGMMKNTTEALMSGIQEMQGTRHDITELRAKLAERDHQLATMRKRLRKVEQ